ncbi:MAG: glycosyltransferase family 2 protein [Nanoarchaeota archaeon]|nr:glycosyltransferase family 2 protein [Nanoarchaeota archaeon]
MLEITIIIPTYNRKEILKKVLDALNNQSYDLKKIEVLVIDDCSKINPKIEIKKVKTEYKLRFLRLNKNVGQGRVRNQAIKLAKGKYLLFLGDDTIPEKNMMEEHINLHRKYKGIAVLGKVSFHNSLRNEFMNYIENIQFHYNTIKDKSDVKLHFYTSNISLEKSWFKDEEYSKEFKNYGFEDLELGYRLEKKGLRVVYNPKAIVYHFHSYTFEQFCQRMRNVGRSAVIFTKLHPELKKRYILPFHNIFKLGSFVLSNKFFKRVNKRIYWYSNFVYNYLIGIEEELENVEKTKNISSFLDI